MSDRSDTWNGKHILKIKSDELKEINLGDELPKSATEKDAPPTQAGSERQSPIECGNSCNVQTPESLRKDIEPWLTALFQSEHLSLLVGTGLTTSVHVMAESKPPQGMDMMKFTEFEEQMEIACKVSAVNTGRGTPNIEDQIRVANTLISGLEVYLAQEIKSTDATDATIKLRCRLDNFKADLKKGLVAFSKDVLETERNIVNSSNLETLASYLTSFLISFCSRSATRERLNLFTTNYDRLIEFGADISGIRLIDRFVGSLNPIFRASRLEIDMHYNPPGIRGEPRYLEGVAHYTKLHGSLDWISNAEIICRYSLPFGTDKDIKQYFPISKTEEDLIEHLMIYPNASKDRETAEYPYVELFRDLAAAICRPNATLVLYGYGFGDDHINRIIQDMLTIPSTHLVIISFSDEGNRVKRFFEKVGRPAQVTLLIGRHFGSLENLVDYYLPKPAIDRATLRMADLLKNRGLNYKPEKPVDGSDK